MAEIVDNFINSLSFSSGKAFETRRFVSKSREFFNETRDFQKSPVFYEKQTDTQELELYQQMFETKQKISQKSQKEPRKVDFDQQTEFIDHLREKSPAFYQGIEKKPMDFPLNVKDLYKSKNKHGFFRFFYWWNFCFLRSLWWERVRRSQ